MPLLSSLKTVSNKECIMIRYRHISVLSTAMVFCWAVIGTTLPGCGPFSSSAQKEFQGQQAKLARKWVLHEMTLDQEGVTVPQSVATLEFSENQYHGTSGCNSCSGDYILPAHGQIQLGGGVWTEMGCQERLMNFEMSFATVLGRITHFIVSDTELQLSDGTAHNQLIFKPYQTPPPLDLHGTVWTLEYFEESDEIAVAVTQVLSERQITLSINEGSVEGFGGVSPYQGTVELGNGSIKLSVSAASSGSASNELTGQQELYLNLLNNATQLQVDHLRLRISNSSGTQSLIFTPSSNAKQGEHIDAAKLDQP
jgi:heat shock protein HslJ